MAQDKSEKSLSDMATARQARIESIESDVRHLKDEISQMHAQILALSVPRVVTGNNGPNFVRMLCNSLECAVCIPPFHIVHSLPYRRRYGYDFMLT